MSDYLPHLVAAAAVGVGVTVYLQTRGHGPIRPSVAPSTPEELSPYRPDERVFGIETDARMPIRLAKRGVASIPPIPLHEVFRRAAESGGDHAALKWESPSGEWKVWTWRQYHEECERAARAFIHLGLQAHESVNIIGFNSPEWFFCNNGAILAGGKAAGIYTTNAPEACAYITEHSEARVVVVENEQQLDKFLKIWDKLPRLQSIIVYRPADEAAVNRTHAHGRVYSYSSFIQLAHEIPQAELVKRYTRQDPGHCCLLIYTSGTTGAPKAVMISQDNIFFTAQTVLNCIGQDFGQGEEVGVSYLPLSHIAAQIVDIWNPIFITALRPGYMTIVFARPDALRGTLAATLKYARPTFFFGVPRVWEKMMESIKAVGAKNTGLKKQISAWARATGAAYWKQQQTGGSGAVPVGYGIAKKIVFSKVRAALGLQRCKMQYTGAAPMAQDVFDFFASLDLPVFELYGMSECCGPQTVTYTTAYRAGATGTSLAGTELKLDHSPGRDKEGEGEICYRGRHVMMGYMKDATKTRETIDPEGFLHSGDVGRLDADGFLYITGRIKELIITAGGENIAPVPIENTIKAVCPGLSNVMMVGDRRKYNVCLVTIKAEVNPDTGLSGNNLVGEALSVAPGVTTVSEARTDKRWEAYVQKGIDEYNKQAVSQAQKIQKFAILEQDFSIQHELTPTLKLKRDVTAKKYAAVIDALYEE